MPPHVRQRRVEAESGLDADREEVDGVGKGPTDRLLSADDALTQTGTREQVAEEGQEDDRGGREGGGEPGRHAEGYPEDPATDRSEHLERRDLLRIQPLRT